MTKLSQKLAAATVVWSILLSVAITQTAMGASNQLSVGSVPAEFVVGDPNGKNEVLRFQVFVASKSPQRLAVKFVDFYTDESGNRSQLPAGSTPYSLANVLEIESFDVSYPGGGRQKQFEITIRPKKNYELALFTGGVAVVLEPLGTSGSGVGSASSILRTLTVTPYGLAASLAEGDLLPAKIMRHDLKRLQRSSFIDSVLPDIPGVVNSGPVESTISYKNQGEYPVFAGISWEFMSGGTVIASKEFRPSPLSPGQQVTKTVSTEVSGVSENSKLNLLPSFGWVSNNISLSSSLGGTNLPVQTYDGSFLVIQWKEPFVALLALYFLVRWAWRKNLSERKKQESTSLVWLAIRELLRKRSGLKPKQLGFAKVSANPEVQLQGFSAPAGQVNKYDIKPNRPSLLDSPRDGFRGEDSPPGRF